MMQTRALEHWLRKLKIDRKINMKIYVMKLIFLSDFTIFL